MVSFHGTILLGSLSHQLPNKPEVTVSVNYDKVDKLNSITQQLHILCCCALAVSFIKRILTSGYFFIFWEEII
jgi:hypothetical protein